MISVIKENFRLTALFLAKYSPCYLLVDYLSKKYNSSELDQLIFLHGYIQELQQQRINYIEQMPSSTDDFYSVCLPLLGNSDPIISQLASDVLHSLEKQIVIAKEYPRVNDLILECHRLYKPSLNYDYELSVLIRSNFATLTPSDTQYFANEGDLLYSHSQNIFVVYDNNQFRKSPNFELVTLTGKVSILK